MIVSLRHDRRRADAVVAGRLRLRAPRISRAANVMFVLVLFGLAMPEQAVIIARHQLFSGLEAAQHLSGLILPGLSAPFGVFLMTQYFRAIPQEIDEAALLDNASRFKIFWRVLLPLTLPAQATLGIFTFLHAWNDYWWPLISATKKEMYTLTVGIASTQTNFAQTEGLGFLMAQAVFAGAADPDRLPVLPEIHRHGRLRRRVR